MPVRPPPRQFPLARIPLALLAAAAVLAACAGVGAPPAPLGAPLGLVSARLREPIVVKPDSATRVLNATLEVDTATLRVPLGRDSAAFWNLKTYRLLEANGVSYADSGVVGFPGPTFRVRRGDRVRIKLVNSLPPSSNDACQTYPAHLAGVDTFQDCFHGPTWTNIHYHGMHVTPSSPGDDVLLMVAPGDTFQYDFVIPDNQSPGTHWYHPHKHGSVALQVINGMSGAFIVEGGGLDSLTRKLKIREHMLAIQQVDTQVNLVRGAPGGVPQLVNGQYRPILVMQAGEVQRWRIVNENVNPTAQSRIGFVDVLGVDEPKVLDVARDGVQYAPANYDTTRVDTTLLMAPGNRLDVLVRAPATPGRHLFRAAQVGHRALRAPSRNPDARASSPPDTLFEVVVVPRTHPVATTLPAELPPLPGFLGNLGTQPQVAVVVFSDSLPRDSAGGQTNRSVSSPTRFFLGSAQQPYQKFDAERVFIPTSAAGDSMPMELEASQTWQVMNHSEVGVNHPFHIHINPFQVVRVHQPNPADPNAALYAEMTAAAAAGSPIWLDVVPLPLARTDAQGNVLDPGYVVINQRYADFHGLYVMHCHILGHEERGMMQVLQVFGPDGRRVAAPEGAEKRLRHRGGNGAAHHD